MSERFDLKRMLQEILRDEKVSRGKPVLLTQQEIRLLRDKLRREQAEKRGRS